MIELIALLCFSFFYLWLLSWHKYKDHYDQSKPRRQLIKDGRDGKQNQGNQDHDNKEDQDSLIEKSLLNSGTPASEQDHTDKHTLHDYDDDDGYDDGDDTDDTKSPRASLPEQTKAKGCLIQSMTTNKFWNCWLYPFEDPVHKSFRMGTLCGPSEIKVNLA